MRLHDRKAEEYNRMYPKSSWSSWKKSWFYMTVTKDDGLYFIGKRANENIKWRSTVEKTGIVERWINAIQDLKRKGLTAWHVVRDFTMHRISPLKLREHSLLWYIGRDEAIKDSKDGKS